MDTEIVEKYLSVLYSLNGNSIFSQHGQIDGRPSLGRIRFVNKHFAHEE